MNEDKKTSIYKERVKKKDWRNVFFFGGGAIMNTKKAIKESRIE